METSKRVLKAINWGEIIHISDNYLFSATINHSGDVNKGLPSENDRQNANLIVTAVNACKAINGANPLNAASHLVELVDMYKQLQQKLELFINATPTGEMRVQLTGLNILALLKLQQATE